MIFAGFPCSEFDISQSLWCFAFCLLSECKIMEMMFSLLIRASERSSSSVAFLIRMHARWRCSSLVLWCVLNVLFPRAVIWQLNWVVYYSSLSLLVMINQCFWVCFRHLHFVFEMRWEGKLSESTLVIYFNFNWDFWTYCGSWFDFYIESVFSVFYLELILFSWMAFSA